MKKLSTILMSSILVVFLAVGSASATAILRLTDDGGVNWMTIADGDGNDSNINPGGVSYTGPLTEGSVWTIDVTTGVTYPTAGSEISPEMNLATFNACSSEAGALLVEFTETSFLGSDTVFMIWQASGVIGATLDASAYYDPENSAFGRYGLILESPHQYGPGEFFDLGLAPIPLGDSNVEYSLTMVFDITHRDEACTRAEFGIEPAPVPEPSTMVLLGFGLIGLAGFTRKKFK